MTMITPSYLGETIEYSSLHACRSTLEDPTSRSWGHCGTPAQRVPNRRCYWPLPTRRIRSLCSSGPRLREHLGRIQKDRRHTEYRISSVGQGLFRGHPGTHPLHGSTASAADWRARQTSQNFSRSHSPTTRLCRHVHRRQNLPAQLETWRDSSSAKLRSPQTVWACANQRVMSVAWLPAPSRMQPPESAVMK